MTDDCLASKAFSLLWYNKGNTHSILYIRKGNFLPIACFQILQPNPYFNNILNECPGSFVVGKRIGF